MLRNARVGMQGLYRQAQTYTHAGAIAAGVGGGGLALAMMHHRRTNQSSARRTGFYNGR